MGKLESIAELCHEANRAYCQALGDQSQVPWPEAADWQKESAIAGVKYVMENPKVKPSDSHESWLREKEKDGWKYGRVKDVEKKEHPCFVSYDSLSIEQKAKDHIFLAIVKTVLRLNDADEIIFSDQILDGDAADDFLCERAEGDPESNASNEA